VTDNAPVTETSPVETNRDIIDELLSDHQEVAGMMARIEQAPPSEVDELFWSLTNALIRHEVAEEEILYPEVRTVVPNGRRLADARVKEQARAEELLQKMEKAGTDDQHFRAQFTRLQKAVQQHAEKEERLIFEPLRRVLDRDRRVQLAWRYKMAKAAAPTHPHPEIPHTIAGETLVRPAAALFDLGRDSIHRVES
jgi:hemerythrin superfamily protein